MPERVVSREGRARWAIGWRLNRNARTLFLGPGQRFVIGKPGNPMMERWRLIQTPLFGLYVHFIYREDLDRVPHDHPWVFRTLVLRGGYNEQVFDRPGSVGPESFRYKVWHRWSVHRFPLHHAHRIVGVAPGTVTLVLVGRKLRMWGFYDGDRWIDYRDALGLRPTEGIAAKRPA